MNANKVLKRTSRPTGEERRSRILIAAAPLFDEKGLEGTQVRDIAAAAGVSAALLYKHFPTKEAIYSEIRSQYANLTHDEEYLAIERMAPSSEKLAIAIVALVRRHLTGGLTPGFGTFAERTRVMLNSFADAGQYARTYLLGWENMGYPRVLSCLQVAEQAGDCVINASPRTVSLIIDLIVQMLGAMHVSDNVDFFQASPEAVIRDVSGFCLKGAGLTPTAIDRVLDPAIEFDAEYWRKETYAGV
jgi:TetR/AcrR family transcriptional regulator, transcriptional repressor of aconitase